MKTKTFLRDDESGLLYCNDGLFRAFVQFGNDSGCLKFWSKAGFADLKAKKLGLSDWSILHVHPGDSVDCLGNVISKSKG